MPTTNLKYSSLKKELLFRNRRILVFLIFIGIFSLSYSIGSESKLSNEDSKSFLKDFQKVVQGIDGFTALFRSRYSKLLKIMMQRAQSKKLTPISNVTNGKLDEETYIAGLLMDRRIDRDVTKLVIDDPTGSIELLIFNKEIQETANSLLIDQFVMISIASGKNGGFFVKEILVPDIPEHIANRSKTETYAVLISDLHVGSKFFMEKEFTEFVSWLSSPDLTARVPCPDWEKYQFHQLCLRRLGQT